MVGRVLANTVSSIRLQVGTSTTPILFLLVSVYAFLVSAVQRVPV